MCHVACPPGSLFQDVGSLMPVQALSVQEIKKTLLSAESVAHEEVGEKISPRLTCASNGLGIEK